MQFSKHKIAMTGAIMALTSIPSALALPIGFGVNQGPLKYSEIRNDDFIVYHDERTPSEGKMAINSLIAAKPYLEAWFDVKRTRALPVVMSAVSDNASFANFITDTVELQTLGQGTRDLFWHEYVHSTMYRHLDNWFGPAGSILHLPWMPAWFIEGLAESLSVSVGSDVQAGIERYQALTGDWPSFDKLHSLYGKNTFALRGYATSGSFISWMLRKNDPAKLPDLLKDYYKYSMPWWWPWATVPFNGFMPMDESLRNFAGDRAPALYEKYKAEATVYWKERSKNHLVVKVPGISHPFANTGSMYSTGDTLLLGVKHDGQFFNASVNFDEKTGWAKGWDEKERLRDDLESWARVMTEDLRVTVVGDTPLTGPTKSKIRIDRKSQKSPIIINRRDAFISGTWRKGSELIWQETAQEISRLCTLDIALSKVIKKPECTEFRLPVSLEFLGARSDSTSQANQEETSEIWFNLREQTVAGDRHEIGVYETATRKWRKFKPGLGGQPLSVAFAGNEIWMLTSSRSTRSIRQLNEVGECLTEQKIADLPLRIFGLQSGSIIVAIYNNDSTLIRRLPRSEMHTTPCEILSGHSSPILAAIRSSAAGKGKINLKTAFAAADIWGDEADASKAVPDDQKNVQDIIQNIAPLDQENAIGANEAKSPIKTAKEAAWRGRPVLAFPWIGADDALGPQIGAVSVPLMDHMQNETVRITALYGVQSRYPNTELSLVSNRFTPTLSLTGFRNQTYNGQFIRRSDNQVVSSYLDERGARAEFSQLLQWTKSSVVVEGGWKYSKMTPYLGPTNIRQGNLSEPYLTLSHNKRFTYSSWTNTLSGRAAPPKLNRNFDYNILGASSTWRKSLPILNSRIDLGLEGSRTRGPKRRELQELYRPLKTYIAGTGGGYNQNSFLLYGEGELFSPRFSNTQGRAKLDWTIPIIPNIDKYVWILYFERLDFTAFYNYGGAWRGDGGQLPKASQLIGAHGYNLDLSVDNKGVRFNSGIGTGQVFKTAWQIYGTFGFDALF